VLICVFASLVSCIKTSPKVTTYLVQVKEYKTNVPLPGVKIALLRCSNYDVASTCTDTSTIAAYITDDKGEHTITEDELLKADKGILLSKLRYVVWS